MNVEEFQHKERINKKPHLVFFFSLESKNRSKEKEKEREGKGEREREKKGREKDIESRRKNVRKLISTFRILFISFDILREIQRFCTFLPIQVFNLRVIY